MIGASNNVNGRSGNTLPSPADVHADENLSSSVNGVASNSNNVRMLSSPFLMNHSHLGI